MAEIKVSGVRIIKKKRVAVFHIDDFSLEIQNIIREKLSSICFGYSKGRSTRTSYSYKKTLNEFLKRYDGKKETTQLGMIGELLTHTLVSKCFTEMNAVLPYFNMEEKSIKKGFDVILYSKGENELWITEVKSGQLHKNKSSDETVWDLLGSAKRDLQKRLNENETSLWENAINGATVALESHRDVKDAVIEILGDIGDEVSDEKANSIDKNVILVTPLFAELSDEIKEITLEKFLEKIEEEMIFKNIFLFAFQKATYQKVVQFLKSEAI